MSAQVQLSNAQVLNMSSNLGLRSLFYWQNILFGVDACGVNNGDCDINAICSHDGTSNAVVCTCKTGYTNTGSAPNVTCTGEGIVQLGPTFHTESTVFCICLDTCLVNNGGCDKNADCSHESATNAVKCSCKTGYANTANGSNAVCTGKSFQHQLIMIATSDVFRCLSSEQWWVRYQFDLLS